MNSLKKCSFLLTFALFLVAGCEQEKGAVTQSIEDTVANTQIETTKNAWFSHLKSVPDSWVSAYGPLSIIFSHPVLSDGIAFNQHTAGIVVVEPYVPASVTFISDRELSIKFDEPLDRAVEYTISLFPNKLSGINNDLPQHQITVQPYQQDFSVDIDGLKAVDEGDKYSVNGRIRTNDADNNDNIEKILSATQEGKDLAIQWIHDSPTEHFFTISDVVRKNAASEVKITWDGKPINVNKFDSLPVTIPSIAGFNILGAVSKYETSKYIEINFSTPLARNQSFKGLIKIQDQAPSRTSVDGNTLRVYPKKRLEGDIKIEVFAGIKSVKNERTADKYETNLTILNEKPGIRFKDTANILPTHAKVIVPIEAVNVDSVQITAYKMPSNNLGQFVQSRSLTYSYVDHSTTAALWKKTYRLPEIPKDKWMQFNLDLTEQFTKVEKDLLAFEIKIDKSNSILDCGEKRPIHDDDSMELMNKWPFEINSEQPTWVQKYYKSRGIYSWKDRENPCKDSYYQYSGENKVEDFRYFHRSNIGLLAKVGVDKSMLAVATDINSAQPLSGVEIVAYNAQNQPVANVTTNDGGMIKFTPTGAPSYLVATYGDEVGFLRLSRNEALSTNVFDTGGEKTGSGIKGFFYGERGVWRPGDDIYLTFVVHDRTGNFPKNYPLTLDFFDPRGNKFDSVTNVNPLNGFYHYRLRTNKDSPTGRWRAVIKYGGQYFSKVLPIETIKPNRLKIDLAFPTEELSAKLGPTISGNIFSQWLNGAVAEKLKADIQMNVSTVKTKISGFDDYIFDDPARKLKPRKQKVFEGSLNDEGKAEFSLRPSVNGAPGKLKLNFTTRVFEKSGNFSIQYSSIPYMPYEKLVGINIPKGSGWNGSISRNDTHTLNFITLDDNGNLLPNTDINFEVYRVGWRWWWDSSSDNIASYINSKHANRLLEKSLKTDANGRTTWNLVGKDYDWGRYLLRACEPVKNHCAGKIVYLGWSYTQNKNPSGDTQLMLSTDKKRYSVGDTAKITIPQAVPDKKSNAKILLTMESGSKILSQQWIEKAIIENQYEIKVTEDMVPNVYAHVTLIQGYADKVNDSPVRLYGIAPLLVDSDKRALAPQIIAPEKVAPQSTLTVGVAEKNGKGMTYTLAIVDEGLLGITDYKTPDPVKQLYQREALGVLTWDMYDLLSRTSIFQTERLLTIGGSDSDNDDDGKRKKRRFPPVVKFIGPFELGKGATAEHNIQLPEYMGAVRVMLVAGDHSAGYGAYGRAERTIKVTQPLTLLATLPRVIGPNEEFKLPINVFSNDKSIKEVEVSVEANELFEVAKSTEKLIFDKPGDQILSLDIKTLNVIGQGAVTVKARSGKAQATQTINITVRTANLPQVISDKAVIQPGEKATLSLTPNGILNTNSAYFEISRVPQINLESRLDYLIGYPHGCLEQITSRLFPQIFLRHLLALTDDQQAEIQSNLDAGFKRYANFQSTNGDFNYWPGGNYSNGWSNNYAGHLLIEAKKMGYMVPASLFDKWLKAQQQHGKATGSKNGYESTDAYTLYTLALADKADFNAMNRLKEKLASMSNNRSLNSSSSNHRVARWLLASAYAHTGVQDAAEELFSMGENLALDYEWAGYTYGSRLRDGALLAMTYNRIKRPEAAWEIAQDIAQQISQTRWYSTQSLAWGLMAIADYFSLSSAKDPQPVSWRINNGLKQKTHVVSPIYKQVLENDKEKQIDMEVFNESKGPFYVLLGNKGIPANSAEVESSQGVNLAVSFTDMEGGPVDVTAIKQGEDFKVRVRVSAKDRYARLENLALTMITPSGWEISSDRMQGLFLAKGIEYQDIRDDRVLSYFTLGNYYWWHRKNKRDITVEITLNAAYAGKFYLPGWRVESMYDYKISANSVGQWVNVVP